MSNLSVPRRLEVTGRTALEAAAALAHVNLLPQNEELPPTSEEETRLPCVIIKAAAQQENLAVIYAGKRATDCDLSFECRVAGNSEDSSLALETLAHDVRDAWENATGLTGWRLLQVEFQGDERGFGTGARSITLKYNATALPI